MPIQLNHTIVPARNPQASATFLAQILGRPAPVRFGPFHGVELDNAVTLDYFHAEGTIPREHYAFLVSEEEFDAILARINERKLPIWADPMHQRAGMNHNDGGRGLYWSDPDGHNLEIITRPYGSGG